MECNQRFETKLSSRQGERGGEGRLFGVNLYPSIVYCVASYTPHLSHL